MQDIFEEELEDMLAGELAEERSEAERELQQELPGEKMAGAAKADENEGYGAEETEKAAAEEEPAGEAASEEEEGGDGEEAADKKGEKRFFQKKADKKTAALEGRIAELEDKAKRQMAEFDNFRKRTDKEKSQMFAIGAKNVVEKILPVIDNFERGLAAVEEEKRDSFYEGMSMIYKQLMDELAKLGVTPIEALGKEFDPNFHNAVMQVESEELETGFIAQELQKGYQYRDIVVRHSMVAVVQ